MDLLSKQNTDDDEKLNNIEYNEILYINKILITTTKDVPFQLAKPLNTTKLDFIKKILRNKNNEFSTSTLRYGLSYFHFKFLANTMWLSCSIIDFYTDILNKKFENTHYFFSVLFMEKLFIEGDLNYNYENVKRWNKSKLTMATLKTPKINIFKLKLLFIPMNYPTNLHFFLFVVNLEYKMIFYFNSLNNNGEYYCSLFSEQIKRYLNEESKQFDIINFDCTDYKVINMDNFDCPKQMDGHNCGVFTIMFMEFIAHGSDYSLVNHFYMDYFREYIAISLKQGINFNLLL